jgi:chitin synthase
MMVNCMQNDPLTMGLCGETRIANKRDSWVTMIQGMSNLLRRLTIVFEYYISHHLGKGFESVFGGVTCLPGWYAVIKTPI